MPKTKGITEEQFDRELTIFNNEVERGARFFSAYLTVSVAASSSSVESLLNTAPRFWNTIRDALQITAIIALGRVFDQKTDTYNLDRLLKIAQDNLNIFSKEALGRRKLKLGPKLTPLELEDYLRSAYEPTPEDFRRLRKCVKKWRTIYENNYRNIRHKLFAHTEMLDRAETNALLAKTNIGELQRLFSFLLSLHQALSQLFINGRKLDLSAPAGRTVQDIITQEAERFLLAAAGVT
jgi:hypothetical protein